MRIAPSLLAATLSFAALAPPAFAAPPLNDNYLASLPVDSVEFSATSDTTEATTQPDVFNPSRDGQPLGGGTTENTVCKGTPFGKTVWYDLAPQADGAVESARAPPGSRRSSPLYEWSESNSQITQLVDCTPVAGGRLQLEVKRSRNYTIQVGGVGGAGGAADAERRLLPRPGRRRRLRRARQVPGGGGDRSLRRLPAGAEGRPERRLRPHRQRRHRPAADRRSRAQGREGRRPLQRLRVADGEGEEARTGVAGQARGQDGARRREHRDPRHAGQDRHRARTASARPGATSSGRCARAGSGHARRSAWR